MSEHNTLDVQRRLICAPWATMGIMVQAPPIGKHSCIVECPSIMLTPPPPNPNKSTPWWWLIKGIIKFVQLQLATLNLVDWVGETNPGRTRLRAFLGVLDWLVPPMPERSQHAQLGDVKQFHEDLHPNTAQGLAVDRASLQQHSEEACKSIDLGRMSNENMPNEVMVNILAHLTEPVMPHYQNLDGKAASYFLRLWEFRTPTYEIEGLLYGEHKCDVLKALTINNFGEMDLQGNWWIPW